MVRLGWLDTARCVKAGPSAVWLGTAGAVRLDLFRLGRVRLGWLGSVRLGRARQRRGAVRLGKVGCGVAG